MDKIKYSKLPQSDNPLKIDNDLIEIQKTIIYYGEKILKNLTKLHILIKEINLENKEIENNNKDPINQYLKKLIISKDDQAKK